jgi:pimeloyl-ACP methyl ester carboxylesterase
MNQQASAPSGSRRQFLTLLAAVSLAGYAPQPSKAAGETAGAESLLGFRKIGSGPQAVLVMHEWLGDHANWEPVWPYLDGARFTYIFVDLRGYGWSRNLSGAYSAGEAVADGLRIMDLHGFQRFHIVGHSMSGMIAQRFLVAAPGRVMSLVAISPVPAAGFKADEKMMKALAAVIDDDAAAKNAIAARGGDRYGETWLNFKLGLARRAATKEAMAGYLKMFTGTDFADAVRGNRTPVLAITGRHDIPFYREESVRRNFEPLYPDFSLAVCEEAGHYAMLEAPVFVASNIEKFTGRHS